MGFFSDMGRTLVLVREMKGFRQSALARAAGIGKSQLSKYECGRELPKLETLERILETLNVEPIRFFESVAWVNELASAIETGRRPLPAFGRRDPVEQELLRLAVGLGRLASTLHRVRLHDSMNRSPESPIACPDLRR